jgi:hypothetical protein
MRELRSIKSKLVGGLLALVVTVPAQAGAFCSIPSEADASACEAAVYLDGDDIILKTAPYFLFQDCITYKVGLYESESILKTKEYLEMAANALWEKNPLDD